MKTSNTSVVDGWHVQEPNKSVWELNPNDGNSHLMGMPVAPNAFQRWVLKVFLGIKVEICDAAE